MNLNDLRMSLKSALDNMWARIDARITSIEQGGVAKSGDTMTGPLTVPSLSVSSDVYQFIFMLDANGVEISHIRGHDTNHVITFREITPNTSGAYEDYSLPSPTIQSGAVPYSILTTKSPVTIGQGGTGATTSAVTITNNYSSVLNAINAVKGSRIFPISIQKTQYGSYSDMPTGYETSEWNMLLVGDSIRLTATLYLFAMGSGRHIYVRDFYNGSWFDSQWTQIH